MHLMVTYARAREIDEEKEQKRSLFPYGNSSWMERERMHIAIGFVEN